MNLHQYKDKDAQLAIAPDRYLPFQKGMSWKLFLAWQYQINNSCE